MRGKYRSAIYVFDDAQSVQAKKALENVQAGFDEPLVTRALDFEAFRPSDERFRNYHLKNAEGLFCTRDITPKLNLLRAESSTLVSGV